MSFTVAFAAAVDCGKFWPGGPPCWLMKPIVTGDLLGSALPDPPTYAAKSLTLPVWDGDAEEAEALVAAGALVVAAGADALLELLELQADAAATRPRHAANTTARFPRVIILVKRTIALSAFLGV
jgi:hypothetical protein